MEFPTSGGVPAHCRGGHPGLIDFIAVFEQLCHCFEKSLSKVKRWIHPTTQKMPLRFLA
jgi:hypothetical protein